MAKIRLSRIESSAFKISSYAGPSVLHSLMTCIQIFTYYNAFIRCILYKICIAILRLISLISEIDFPKTSIEFFISSLLAY